MGKIRQYLPSYVLTQEDYLDSKTNEPEYNRALKPILMRDNNSGTVNFIPLAISIGGTHSPEVKSFLQMCSSRAVENRTALGYDGYSSFVATAKYLMSLSWTKSCAESISNFRAKLSGFPAENHMIYPFEVVEWPDEIMFSERSEVLSGYEVLEENQESEDFNDREWREEADEV